MDIKSICKYLLKKVEMYPEDYDNQYDNPSRLSTGKVYYRGAFIPISEYRNMIVTRNLFSVENEYETTNLFSLRNKGQVANGIASVLNVLPQYNNISTQTNFLGNVADSFGADQSPLTRIGLIMLGKQMLLNSAQNLSTKYLGSLDTSQLLRGNPEKVWKRNIDNRITLKDPKDKTTLEKIAGFGEKYLGVETYDVFGDGNPFTEKDFTAINAIRNTGEGQLAHYFQNINRNVYKLYNSKDDSQFSELYLDYSENVGQPLDLNRNQTIRLEKKWFNFNNRLYHPYWNTKLNSDAIRIANDDMRENYTGFSMTEIQEYAPSQDFINENFGSTSVDRSRTTEDFVGGVSNLSPDNNMVGNLAWGRDGVGEHAENWLANNRGDDDEVTSTFNTNNINTGLLDYTKNLLNATEGRFVDITRKVFKKGDDGDVVGFQGSGLWRGNNSTYAQTDIEGEPNSAQAGKAGVRQHTTLDPYNKFAKLIRFNGNKVYLGSPESVVHRRVLPRIHPTLNTEGGIDNKNLMFSIENLAVGTIKREKYGVIDDEYGSPIPLSEVGPFAGRMMWFPPYNIEINEVASANYDSTVMIGRNEPMYNYMNSERSAVVSFTLLVDYPEHVRNVQTNNLNGKHKAIADFFAFGGDPLPDEVIIETLEKKLKDLENQKPEVTGPDDPAEPPTIDTREVKIYFPNDQPSGNSITTIIDEMYRDHYEILNEFESSDNGNGFGLNENIYFQTGITGSSRDTYGLDPSKAFNTSQYDLIRKDDEFATCPLNVNLLDFFSDEQFRKYYNIEISGEASKLYLSANERAYNEALGDRRVQAAKHLVVRRLAKMFGENVARELEQNNIKTIKSTGSLGNSEIGAKPENMHLKEVKQERSATLKFVRNTTPVDKIEKTLTPEQQKNLEDIEDEIRTTTEKLNRAKKNIVENIYNERSKAMLMGTESIEKNEFNPVFHSQTPEDLHRRLTFLHQCTRQGAAKRYDLDRDDTGVLRARNSVFGRQPICILRVGDFFHTKVVIESVTIDYADAPWDLNPEGFGLQPMFANITLQMKLIGGQSLKGPIDALQNAVSFNYYANSSFTDRGMYARPFAEAEKQQEYIEGVLTTKRDALNNAYDNLINSQGNSNIREGQE
jgi:hypothetical protein